MHCFVPFLLLISLFGEIHNAAIGVNHPKELNSFQLINLVYNSFKPKNGTEDSSPIISLLETKEYLGQIPHTKDDAIGKKIPFKKPSKEFRIPLKQNYVGRFGYKTNNEVLIEKLKDGKKTHTEIAEGSKKGPSYFIYGEKSPKPVVAYNSFEPENGTEDSSSIIPLLDLTSTKEYLVQIPQAKTDATGEKKTLKKPAKELIEIPLKQNEDGSFDYKTNNEALVKKLLKKINTKKTEGSSEGATYFVYGEKSSKQVFKLIRLAYNLFEPKNGTRHSTPIIFLHGITSTKEYWGQIPQTIADATGRKTYAVDARDHGDTAWSNDFNFDINVIDLELFLNEIKAKKVILVGHSMGGITAMKTALKQPKRVKKMVIEDITTKGLNQATLDVIIVFMKICLNALKVVPPGIPMESAQEIVMAAIIKELPDSVKAYIKPSKDFKLALRKNKDGSFGFKTNFKVLIEKLKDGKKMHTEITEGSYNGSSYFIYGKMSPIQVFKYKDVIKEFFLRAKFTGVENCSHVIHREKPVEFTDLLLHFFKEKSAEYTELLLKFLKE